MLYRFELNGEKFGDFCYDSYSEAFFAFSVIVSQLKLVYRKRYLKCHNERIDFFLEKQLIQKLKIVRAFDPSSRQIFSNKTKSKHRERLSRIHRNYVDVA